MAVYMLGSFLGQLLSLLVALRPKENQSVIRPLLDNDRSYSSRSQTKDADRCSKCDSFALLQLPSFSVITACHLPFQKDALKLMPLLCFLIAKVYVLADVLTLWFVTSKA
jgi:hypothetical protein